MTLQALSAMAPPRTDLARHLRTTLLALARAAKTAGVDHGLSIEIGDGVPASIRPLDKTGLAGQAWGPGASLPQRSGHAALGLQADLTEAKEAFARCVAAMRARPSLAHAAHDVTLRLHTRHPHHATRQGPFVEAWMGRLQSGAPGTEDGYTLDTPGHTRLTPSHRADTSPVPMAQAVALFDAAADSIDAPRLHAIERPRSANPFSPRAAWISTDALRALDPLFAGKNGPMVPWILAGRYASGAIAGLVARDVPFDVIEAHARLVSVSQSLPDLGMVVVLAGDGGTAIHHNGLGQHDPFSTDAWIARPHGRYHAAWIQDTQAAWSELWQAMDRFAPAVTRTSRAWQHTWHIGALPQGKGEVGARLALYGLGHRPGRGPVDSLHDVLAWMAGVTPHDGWAVSRHGATGPAFVPGKDAAEALAVGLHLHTLMRADNTGTPNVVCAGEVDALDLWTPA